MYTLRNIFTAENQAFSDVSILGNFIDNHDNPRFLHQASEKQMRNALAFSMTMQGIPIMYYGTEQLFHGGNDPEDREPLWTTNLEITDTYTWIATINKARTETKWFQETQIERWADELFYAYTRGTTLCLFSNDYNAGQGRTINYHEYKVGDVLRNIFNPADQVIVTENGVTVTVSAGVPKIYTLVNKEGIEEEII